MLTDLRRAFRALGQSPGFAVTALLTLALGIGATTAVFSLVHGVVLRPLPYPEPDRIMVLNEARLPTHPETSGTPPTYLDLREKIGSFGAVSAARARPYNLTGSGEPVRCNAEQVTADFFVVMGVAPALGRAFTRDEEAIGQHEVAVLSHAFWKNRLGGRPEIVGESLQLDGVPYRVIGVMPASFRENTDLWTPLAFTPDELTPIRRGAHSLAVSARLQPGVTLGQARAEVAQLAATLQREFPETNGPGWDITVTPLGEISLRGVRTLINTLLGAVACVLLIVCTNIANLFFARATVRAREFAVRSALGASRWQLMRQMLAESVLLSAIGGGLGLFAAAWGIQILPRLARAQIPRLDEIGLSAPVLLFAVGIAALTSVLCGLVPAWQASRVDLNDALKSGSRGSTDARGGRWREGLVVAEITLAFVLLAGAGVFLGSFARLQAESLGIEPQDTTIVTLALPRTKYGTSEAKAQFIRAAEREFAALPGVVHVGATDGLPFRSYSGGPFHILGTPVADKGREPITIRYLVSPDYQPALGLRLLRGRFLTAQDNESAPPVVVISELFAKKYFGGQDPLGQRLELYSTFEPKVREIVGIVADTKLVTVDEATPMPQAYESTFQHTSSLTFYFAIRHPTGSPAPGAAEIRAAVYRVDPNQPVARVESMESIVAGTLARQRFGLQLLATFALLAFVITVVGIYGVTAFNVSRRRNEIGIRLALGATSAQIRQLVLGRGMRLAVLGLGGGVVLMLGLGRLLQSLLYRTQASDPLVLGGIAVVLLGVTLLACWLPARRATKVDPLIALRTE